jgi:hypothetical protein
MIDPVTGQGVQMGGLFTPGGGGIGQAFTGIGQIMTDPEFQQAAGATATPEDNQQLQQAFTNLGNTFGGGKSVGGQPGMGGKGGMMIPQSMGDQVAQQQGGMPGMGGKGPLSQIPVDMNGQVLGTGQGMFSPGSMGQQVADQQANMPTVPQAPPAAVAQGGTPGRPVPSAPMSPRGPGYANPGASGVARSLQGAQQQMFAPQGILTNPQGQNQPLTGNFQPSGMQTRLQPARPVAPAPINRPLTGNFQPTMPQRRGAGRGGMLR